MTDPAQIEITIRELILASWPERFTIEQLDDAALLGEEGLGLDSIELAELILSCEERCDGRASETLFTTRRLTIGLIADHFSAPS